MSPILRLWMVALVAVNLLFVLVTEAASVEWLLPMFAVTLAAPALARLQRYLVYRLTWNLSVVAVFALLVHHATSAGIHFLLEDGLRLAAISQVHLVNNLGEKQRPDLLFFNSFLIAIVTAFLTQAIAYSAVFVLFAPVFVIGLQIYCAVGHGTHAVEPGLVRQVTYDGLRRVGVAGLMTAVVFVAWPRDFQRRGLVGTHFGFPVNAPMEVGFTEDVQLQRTGQVTASEKVVLRVHLASGSRDEVPFHWRGATFERFDGVRWFPRDHIRQDFPDPAPWTQERPGVWQRDVLASGTNLRVEQFDRAVARLFTPLESWRLALQRPADPLRATVEADRTVRYASRGESRSRGTLRYEVHLSQDRPALSERPHPRGPASRHVPGTQLPSHPPTAAIELAADLSDQLPQDAPQHRVVERIVHHLSTQYRYLPPGSPGGATDLGAFLEGRTDGAHCEYFASALALLLRMEGVPCRMVSGFLSDEWDVKGQVLTIRQRHAHAWVEVHDPEGGWYTVDPSPALGEAAGDRQPSLLARTRDLVRKAWGMIVSFDDARRAEAAAWLRALPGRLLSGLLEHPLPAAVFGLLAAGLIWGFVRLRRRRVPPAIRAYRQCVRKLGLQLRPGETPRELLARATTTGLPEPKLERLSAATGAHERERYARRAP